MGLFISNCKGCGADITWFLHSSDHDCPKCGAHMSAQEVESSHAVNLFAHYTKLVLDLKAQGKTLQEIRRELSLNPEIVEAAYKSDTQ